MTPALSGASFAAWLIDALIASALLMAAVMAVRGPVRRAFGPQLAYALWALPLLRLLLPPLPSGWWRQAAAAPITRAGETVTVLIVEPLAAAVPSGPSLGLVLAAIWAGGAVVFLLFHLVRHARFCRAVKRDAALIEERDGVQVIASAAAPGPLAFGLARRYVAFPRDFAERYDADERALALRHELGHHARRDLHANWAALVVLALHWFSPLAWRAFHAFRADQELANDARVLAGCGPADRHAYGRAIVKAAHGGQVSAACHLHTITDLKGRLRMLTISRSSRRRFVAGSAAVTLLVAGGLGLTASSGAAEEIRERLAVPAAPVAPLPVSAVQAAPVSPSAAPARSATSRRQHRVVVTRNGETQVFEGADADRYVAEHRIELPEPPVPPAAPGALAPLRGHRIIVRPRDGAREFAFNIPDVQSRNCSGEGPATTQTETNGRQRVIICTNRIERLAATAETTALMGRRMARTNLAMARAAIERDRNLSDEQRQQALAGIAQAEAELRGED